MRWRCCCEIRRDAWRECHLSEAWYSMYEAFCCAHNGRVGIKNCSDRSSSKTEVDSYKFLSSGTGKQSTIEFSNIFIKRWMFERLHILHCLQLYYGYGQRYGLLETLVQICPCKVPCAVMVGRKWSDDTIANKGYNCCVLYLSTGDAQVFVFYILDIVPIL